MLYQWNYLLSHIIESRARIFRHFSAEWFQLDSNLRLESRSFGIFRGKCVDSNPDIGLKESNCQHGILSWCQLPQIPTDSDLRVSAEVGWNHSWNHQCGGDGVKSTCCCLYICAMVQGVRWESVRLFLTMWCWPAYSDTDTHWHEGVGGGDPGGGIGAIAGGWGTHLHLRALHSSTCGGRWLLGILRPLYCSTQP
jgi:hypothetical protein